MRRPISAGSSRVLAWASLVAVAGAAGWVALIASTLAALALWPVGDEPVAAVVARVGVIVVVALGSWYAAGRVIGSVAVDVGRPARTVPVAALGASAATAFGLADLTWLSSATVMVVFSLLVALAVMVHGMRDAARARRRRERSRRPLHAVSRGAVGTAR